MIQSRTLSSIMLLPLLIGALLTGCSSAEQTPVSQAAPQSPEAGFFSRLTQLADQYNFDSIEEIDLSSLTAGASDEGVVWKAADAEIQLLEDFVINKAEGLFLEFSFTRPLSELENVFYFVLAPSSDGEITRQAFISKDGLSLMDGGLPAGSVAFQDALEWQAETRYGMFIYWADGADLQVHVWDSADPARMAVLTTEQGQFAGSAVQFGLKLDGDQDLTIHSVWKTVDSSLTQDAESPAQAGTGASAEIIAGYTVTDATAVDALECSGRSVGGDGVFRWDNAVNEHCDLSMRMREALTFDFILANPADDWSRVSFIMLDGNLEPSDMPVKGLGVPLANDKVISKMDGEEVAAIEYSNGFEIDAGTRYSAMIVMTDNNYFEIEIWAADDPGMRMSAVLTDQNVLPDWLPVEGEEWTFGMWQSGGQQVAISNIVHYILGGSQDDVSTSIDSESSVNGVQDNGAGSREVIPWEDKDISNLSDFFIPGFDPYTEVVCDNDLVYSQGWINLPVRAENITHECQVDLPEGSGLIFEVAYRGETPVDQGVHLFDLAFALGQGEDQKVIRFTPGYNDLVMKDSSNSIDVPTSGNLVWEAGRTYAVAFISSYDKYLFIWPSDDPGQVIEAVIPGGDWVQQFGVQDPGQAWNLRIWLAAGFDLTLQNPARFEAH